MYALIRSQQSRPGTRGVCLQASLCALLTGCLQTRSLINAAGSLDTTMTGMNHHNIVSFKED